MIVTQVAGERDVTELAFPFHVDDRGRTADTDELDHVRDLVEQLLFTAPGERVNRPTLRQRADAPRLRA